MKKIKKILAAIMTLAMVLGMSMTTFAADSATIQVNNLEEGTTVKAVQVIEPDANKTTGWDFVEDLEIRNAYATAFEKTAPQDQDYQDIIWSLILYVDSNATVPEGTIAATAEQINNALNAIPTNKYTINTNVGTTNVFTVKNAGVYAIDAEPAQGSDTVYNPMAAYVGFTYVAGVPTLPADTVVVNAKKTEVPVDKTVLDDDKATGITETVTYQVKTAVPFGLSSWQFTDTISNANYVKVTDIEDENYGKVPVSVTIGTGNPTTYYATVTGSSFVLDLSTLAKDPTYQGAEVTFTYQAEVTGLEVNNSIKYDDKHVSDEIKLYTGSITFTKYNEDKSEKLGGAGFKIYRINEDDEREYAQFSGSTPSYQLTGWGTFEQATEVFTNATEGDTYGTLTVSGLDKDTYYFEETTAPAGYSINESDEDVAFEPGEVSDAFSTKGEMTDTELSALPSTGGIGTTIFTVGGCIIMIAAAGLFFASRRKSSK